MNGHLVQDRIQRQALVNTEINIQVAQKVANFLASRICQHLRKEYAVWSWLVC